MLAYKNGQIHCFQGILLHATPWKKYKFAGWFCPQRLTDVTFCRACPNSNVKAGFMNSFFLMFLSFTVPAILLAADGVLIIQKGEKVYYHSVISNKAKPTLILLPGIFRGLNEED